MMKISIIADSLAMPRIDSDEVIRWESTWPVLLDANFRTTKNYVSLSINNRRARTINTLLGSDFYESIEVIQPKVLIIQIGVVDCMPRIFSKNENILLNKSFFPPRLRSYLIKHRSRKRRMITERNSLKKVYTSPNDFTQTLNEFADKIRKVNFESKIIFLPILINKEVMEQKSPGSISNVKLYNQILRNSAIKNKWLFVDIGAEAMDLFLKDGYHLNVKGHLLIAEKLKALIDEIVKNETR